MSGLVWTAHVTSHWRWRTWMGTQCSVALPRLTLENALTAPSTTFWRWRRWVLTYLCLCVSLHSSDCYDAPNRQEKVQEREPCRISFLSREISNMNRSLWMHHVPSKCAGRLNQFTVICWTCFFRARLSASGMCSVENKEQLFSNKCCWISLNCYFIGDVYSVVQR